MNIFSSDCKDWQGYKPCSYQKLNLTKNCKDCIFYNPIERNVLLIESGGLGSALRTSVVAREVKRTYPNSIIQWLSNDVSKELILKNISCVDSVYTSTLNDITILKAQKYDLIINFESDPFFLAFSSNLTLRNEDGLKIGFTMNENGKLDLSSSSAREFLRLQTDDFFRKRENEKSMQQILLEAVGLNWNEQGYDIATRDEDDEWAKSFFVEHGIWGSSEVIGLNIGSSIKHSAKRWLPQRFYELAKFCQKKYPQWKFLILAGPDDVDYYEIIFNLVQKNSLDNVIFTGWNNSISKFISLVNLASLVISADTFGLHVALGLGKKAVSLWGPQPQNETYSYGNEVKLNLNMECSPCFIGTPDKCLRNLNHPPCMLGINIEMVLCCLEEELLAWN